jgi:SSS family solute:Na+ symporter
MLQPADYGDKVLPWFMVAKVPSGLMGLIVAAILSAAMSTVSSGMNSTATVFLKDIYQRYIDAGVTPKREMKVLYAASALAGVLAIGVGISMIGVGSILDIWWDLSGILAGGMLGLFLLGMVSGIKNAAAVTATIIGILVIIWMSLSKYLPAGWVHLRSHLHAHMVIVVGTLSIFLAGMLLAQVQRFKTSRL